MLSSVKNLNKAINKVIDDVQTLTIDKMFEFVIEHVSDKEVFSKEFEAFKKVLKSEASVVTENKKNVSDRKKRNPSKYNIFIGSKIKELKLLHPEHDGKELMKLAINEWKVNTDINTKA